MGMFEDFKTMSPKRKADKSSIVKANMGKSAWKDGMYRIAPRSEGSPTLMMKRKSLPRGYQGIWREDEVCMRKGQFSLSQKKGCNG
jgi:hypothetical protein